jgi:hypothetical protein
MRIWGYHVSDYKTDDEADLMEENLAIKEKMAIYLGDD